VSARSCEAGERVRSAELVATLCLATDLGMGFPFEHGLHTTLLAMRLGDRLGVDHSTASQTYYASLLSHAGCTADAHVMADVFGGSLLTHFNPAMYGSRREVMGGLIRALPPPETNASTRAMEVARRLPKMALGQRRHLVATCEVAQMLGERVGGPAEVTPLLAHLFERWDGRGPLGRARGDEIPLPMRIVAVATDAAFQRLLGDVEHVARVIGERAGHAFDPEIAACLVEGAGEILALDGARSAWEETLAREPKPTRALEDEAVDRALASIGSFADLVSPFLSGHSAGVAELAGAAAHRCRMDEASVATIRRAAYVHDLGRVAAHPRIWQKPGPLSADEWEQVRLHPYSTERVLSRSPFLSALAPVARAHHERLDGSGYHRGAAGPELAPSARVLAAADAYHAMTESRPHRERLEPERAAAELASEARVGRLDPDAVTAIIEAAGQPPPRLARPGGLTAREVEAVAMLARGMQTKQIARALGISVKTADRHLQHAYRKMGVSTRAAATLFAMEHGLVAWGEFPIGGPTARS
jgi:HD-GYP domain-containing protein (c-di-GMP phosphodiesterase class II)